MDAHELLQKTYDGNKELRLGAGALSIYFTSLNLASILSAEQSKQLASVLLAYIYATDTNPTFLEKYENRVHAKKILKKLAGFRWLSRFDLDKWLATSNWSSANMMPFAILGQLTEPSFWSNHLSVETDDTGYSKKYVLSVRTLEVAPDEAAVPLPLLDKTPLF